VIAPPYETLFDGFIVPADAKGAGVGGTTGRGVAADAKGAGVGGMTGGIVAACAKGAGVGGTTGRGVGFNVGFGVGFNVGLSVSGQAFRICVLFKVFPPGAAPNAIESTKFC
jgi:hypothetical protein